MARGEHHKHRRQSRPHGALQYFATRCYIAGSHQYSDLASDGVLWESKSGERATEWFIDNRFNKWSEGNWDD